MVSKNHTIARLLSHENLRIIEGSFETASFNVDTRTLCVPNWSFLMSDVYDLFIAHEVGHALFTPFDLVEKFLKDSRLKGCTFDALNVLEDIRIERLIQAKYLGLNPIFTRAYRELVDMNFFGSTSSYTGLFNRLNIYAKAGAYSGISLDDREKVVYDKACACETSDDVINLLVELWQSLPKEKPQKKTVDDSPIDDTVDNVIPQRPTGGSQSEDTDDEVTEKDSDSEVSSPLGQEAPAEKDDGDDDTEKSDKSSSKSQKSSEDVDTDDSTAGNSNIDLTEEDFKASSQERFSDSMKTLSDKENATACYGIVQIDPDFCIEQCVTTYSELVARRIKRIVDDRCDQTP
jgi:hypothetical protein